MGKVDELLEEISVKGKSADTYQRLGKSYINIKEIEKAHGAFIKSLELDDSDPWTHLYIGNIFYRKKDYLKAINWFEKNHTVDSKFGHSLLVYCGML
ncbi:tetratricopeptide repeat protein [Aliikangiella coralliicola]|uniref:Uncharacterized protein n=1 Tax=Aliikangiella coralliicola TaxID=2592383 RepID=A0A545UC46_9GAMM|nr:hypothetical protein [Aliikangiella coralliicola]TQV87003.1 hypothetical protein FLL46_14445 [Aliikangiella coralliicola]